MSSIEVRQHELVKQFSDDVIKTLDGATAVMHAGGRGARLDTYRYGREPHRPPCVTVEARPNGALVLGMVVSRPKNGKFVYDKCLGQWDLREPATPGGALNLSRPEHRRALFWGFQLLSALLAACRQQWSSRKAITEALVMPRVLIPFQPGAARVDYQKAAVVSGLGIDSNLIPGHDVVDARIAYDADVMSAINNNLAAEDFRPILGPTIPNPFGAFDRGNLQGNDLLEAARRHVGRANESGATDADLLAALADTTTPLRLSAFSKVQVVSSDSLTQLSLPYGGSMLPAVNWMRRKKNPLLVAK